MNRVILREMYEKLLGKWTGYEETYVAEDGSYRLLGKIPGYLSIVEQKDRLFTGNITYMKNGKEIVEGLAGQLAWMTKRST